MENIQEELSIELDCAPMSPRPDTYINGVLEGTGLTTDDFGEPSKFFGNWKWLLKNQDKSEIFIKSKPIFKSRIEALYREGSIRYGSW